MADMPKIDCRTDKSGEGYEMPGRCSNCGLEAMLTIQKGTPFPSGTLAQFEPCPHCGTTRWARVKADWAP